MKTKINAAALLCLGIGLATALQAEQSTETTENPMEAMMASMAKHTALQPQHAEMNYLLGAWDIKMTLHMPGAPAQTTDAKAEFAWVIDGRWMGQRISGEIMGMPYESFHIHGYDSYAKNFVTSSVHNMDNSMTVTRGVITDPSGQVKVEYGVLNEYLTGELNKPLKEVTRRIDADHFVMDLWDLGVGEVGARVLEYRYSRVKVDE